MNEQKFQVNLYNIIFVFLRMREQYYYRRRQQRAAWGKKGKRSAMLLRNHNIHV